MRASKKYNESGGVQRIHSRLVAVVVLEYTGFVHRCSMFTACICNFGSAILPDTKPCRKGEGAVRGRQNQKAVSLGDPNHLDASLPHGPR